MKTAITFLGLLTVGAMTAWVPSAVADDPKTMSASEIREVLTTMGAKTSESKDDEGKTYWMVATKEKATFLLFQYGGKGDLGTSISASAPFDMNLSLADVNTYNSGHRFVRMFKTDKGIMLESDLDVSVAPSKAVVKKFLADFSASVSKFTQE